MTHTVASREARQQFFKIVKQAYDGEPTVITTSGIAVAAVVSYSDFKRLRDSRMSEDLTKDSLDLERHALAIAQGDTDRAALLLSEALTALLAKKKGGDDANPTTPAL